MARSVPHYLLTIAVLLLLALTLQAGFGRGYRWLRLVV